MLGAIQTQTTKYTSKVFMWMLYGMGLSGLVSFFLLNASYAVQEFFFTNATIFWLLQVGAVFSFALLLRKINTAVAFLLFTVYSALTGLTLSLVLFAYSTTAVVGSFVMTAGIFGVMALIGFTTKIDLSPMRTFFMMSVLGIFFASIVNVFILKSSGLDIILSYVTIVVFAGLTAYDMQRIRETAAYGVVESKYAISDALSMYINFINIFLSILRITDRR